MSPTLTSLLQNLEKIQAKLPKGEKVQKSKQNGESFSKILKKLSKELNASAERKALPKQGAAVEKLNIEKAKENLEKILKSLLKPLSKENENIPQTLKKKTFQLKSKKDIDIPKPKSSPGDKKPLPINRKKLHNMENIVRKSQEAISPKMKMGNKPRKSQETTPPFYTQISESNSQRPRKSQETTPPKTKSAQPAKSALVSKVKKPVNEKNPAQLPSERMLENLPASESNLQNPLIFKSKGNNLKNTKAAKATFHTNHAVSQNAASSKVTIDLPKIAEALNKLANDSEYVILVENKKRKKAAQKLPIKLPEMEKIADAAKKQKKIVTVKEVLYEIEKPSKKLQKSPSFLGKIRTEESTTFKKVAEMIDKFNSKKAYVKIQNTSSSDKEPFKGAESAKPEEQQIKNTLLLKDTDKVQALKIDEIIERIERTISTMKERPSIRERALVKLEPPNLGNLEIEIVKKDEKLQIIFRAFSFQAKDLIEKRIEHLAQRLESQGFSVEKIEVKVEKEQYSREQNEESQEKEWEQQNDQNRRRRKQKEGENS